MHFSTSLVLFDFIWFEDLMMNSMMFWSHSIICHSCTHQSDQPMNSSWSWFCVVTRPAGHLCDSTPTSGADGLLVHGKIYILVLPLFLEWWSKHIQTCPTKMSKHIQSYPNSDYMIQTQTAWSKLRLHDPNISKWLSKQLQNYKTNTKDLMFIHVSDLL